MGQKLKQMSAHRINKLHEVINGEDEVSGGYYDALDHEQLLHGFMHVSKYLQFILRKDCKKTY